ncbi:MAG: LuxR C-terminal-related transcriptional regulator [Anaerolineae bacterium]|jgi:two-component system NarL family response regulator
MIRLLLVDEIQLTCNILAAVLDAEPDITVVGCVMDGQEALARAGACDVILVNTDLGRGESLELLRIIKEAAPMAKVLMLGLIESEDEVLPYIQAGAFGYVLADESVEDLLNRIRTAYEDRALISPDIAAALITRLNELSQLARGSLGGGNGKPDLTPRELQILALIDRGLTNQQIARELVIEVGTVKNHVHNILQKLDVGSREDAATVATLMAQGTAAGVPPNEPGSGRR